MNQPRGVAGLVLVELAAAMAVLAVLVAVLLVATGESRRQSSLGDNIANLKQFATGTGTFAADNGDRVWTFMGPTPSDGREEAWQILRERSGLADWLGPTPPPNWIPYILYSHLPLLDYLDTTLPAQFAIAPEDRLRLLWASDPVGIESLPADQRPSGTSLSLRRWPFSSSYELPPAFYSADAGDTISQTLGGAHNRYSFITTPSGGRRLSEVAFPSQKVMLFDQVQRHFGPRKLYFAYEEARVPIMFVDGSVSVRRTRDANRGFLPKNPLSISATRVSYEPEPWEPPTANGQPSQLVYTHYRFTRSGLRGRDFGGPEIPWVD